MLENGGESNPAIISICMKCTVVAHWPNVLFGSRVFSRVLGCGAPRGSPGRPATSFLDPPRVNIGHASSSFLRATALLCVYEYVFEDDQWKKTHKQRCSWFCSGNTALDPFIEVSSGKFHVWFSCHLETHRIHSRHHSSSNHSFLISLPPPPAMAKSPPTDACEKNRATTRIPSKWCSCTSIRQYATN